MRPGMGWVNEPKSLRGVAELCCKLEQESAAAGQAGRTEARVKADAAIGGWVDSALSELHNAIVEARLRVKETGRPEDAATVEGLEAAKQALVAARASIRRAGEGEED